MSDLPAEPKTYSSPKLHKLQPEQARHLLIGQAMRGNQGAKDLLAVLFADPNEHERVSPRMEGERPGGFVTENPSGDSRLSFHILNPVKEGFFRFIRG